MSRFFSDLPVRILRSIGVTTPDNLPRLPLPFGCDAMQYLADALAELIEN
jgi:hypothetical protein